MAITLTAPQAAHADAPDLAAARAVARIATVALAVVAFMMVAAVAAPVVPILMLGGVGFCLIVVLAVLVERGREVERLHGRVTSLRTQLVEAREREATALATRDRFLANMSHELRTPLNAVMGYTELVLEEIDDAGCPEISRDLRRVEAAAQHLVGLISGILELTRMDACGSDLEISLVDPGALIRDAVAMIQPELERGGCVLEVEGPDEAAPLATDRIRLRQILVNLLSNAAKFTDHGRIDVRWGVYDDHLHVSIADTGLGIPEGSLERIFEQFELLDPSSTRTRGGAGVGLALARRLVTLLEGRMSVSSELGRGTQFILDVPDLEAVGADRIIAAK